MVKGGGVRDKEERKEEEIKKGTEGRNIKGKRNERKGCTDLGEGRGEKGKQGRKEEKGYACLKGKRRRGGKGER